MTPKRYQSGEIDVTGRICRMGDGGVRAALYEAAHVILTMPVKGGALKSWAARLAKRAGMQKAKVALARKLAVILHRMLADASPSMRQRRQRHERPSQPKHGAVLVAVNTASRRLWRWPAASVDRHCARRLSERRPGRRNAVQTEQRNCSGSAAARKEKHQKFLGRIDPPSRSGVPAGTMDWVRPHVRKEAPGESQATPPQTDWTGPFLF